MVQFCQNKAPFWMDFPAHTSEHRRKIDVNPSTDPEDGVWRRGDYREFSRLIQQRSGWQIEIKAPRSAVRHHETIQLTLGDPVIRKTAGKRARKISPGNERRPVGSAEVRGKMANVFMAAGRRRGRKTT